MTYVAMFFTVLWPHLLIQVFPDSFRGAILGFASYAHRNVGALYVSFGSPSVGIATALARVFNRVCD